LTRNLCSSPPSALGHLAVDVERRGGRGRSGELGRPAEPHIAQPVAVRCHPGHQGLGDGGGIGGIAQDSRAAAISGIELTCEVTTGQPQAIASRMGRPKVSLCDG
jgi:hypothetical protein